MKVDLFNRDPVCDAFGIGNNGKDFFSKRSRPVAHNASVDNGADISKVPVLVVVMMFMVMMFMIVVMIMMVMMMLMAVVMVFMVMMLMFMTVVMGFVVMEYHIKGTSLDTAGFTPSDLIMESLNIETFQYGIKFFRVGAQIQKCGDSHISGNSGSSFEVKCFSHLELLLSVDLTQNAVCHDSCTETVVYIHHSHTFST